MFGVERNCDSKMKREDVFKESGNKGEAIVEDILKSKFRSKYIHNYLLRYYGFIWKVCSTEIDFVLVLDKYIFLLEVKHYNRITGYDSKKDEYLVLINVNSRHLKSPIYQNDNHRTMFSNLLNIDVDDIVCISIITTDDGSENVYVKDSKCAYREKNHLVTRNGLINLINEYEHHNKPNLNRDLLFETIECANFSTDEMYQNYHRKYCKFFDENSELIKYRMKFYSCKICGSQMVLRGEKGNYYAGCINYKNCNSRTVSLKNIDEYEIRESEIMERVIFNMSLDEYRDIRQTLLEDIDNLKVEKATYSEVVSKHQYLEMDKKYKEKIHILNKHLDENLKKNSDMENYCKNLESQIYDLNNRLMEMKQSYDALAEKYNNSLFVKLKRLLGIET